VLIWGQGTRGKGKKMAVGSRRTCTSLFDTTIFLLQNEAKIVLISSQALRIQLSCVTVPHGVLPSVHGFLPPDHGFLPHII